MPYGLTFERDDRVYADGLDRLSLPAADALGFIARDAWVHNPLNELSDFGELGRAMEPKLRDARQQAAVPPEADRFLDPADLNRQYGELGLSFDKPTRAGAVDIIVRRKREELTRNAYIARAPGGFWFGAASVATQLAVSAADPLNIASAFLPVVGEARAGLWAARYGRTAARAMQGAVEGAAGAALVEPAILETERSYQGGYDAMDSLLNVAIGGVLGGGLHAGFGAISDLLGRTAPETREAALRASIANLAEGRPVEVEHVLAADPAYLAARTDVEALQRRSEAAGPSLFQTIVDAGGIRTRDAGGAVTREGGEVLAVLRDVRRPGLLNDEGMTPDMLREHLQERGWFGVRQDEGADVQALYDALSSEARGERVFHPESANGTDREFRRALDEEMTRAGVTASDGPRTAARKLADFRKESGAGESSDALRRRADALGIPHDASTPDDELRFSILEREAIRDEANSSVQDAFASRDPLDRAWASTAAFSRGESSSAAASPKAAERASHLVFEGIGDDIEAELADATERLAEFERQGALSADDLTEASAGRELVARADRQGEAARAVARCLLLHP